MRRLIMMEGDVEEGSTPLKDLFDQTAQGQTKVTIAQVKVLSPPPLPPQNFLVTLLFGFVKFAAAQYLSCAAVWPNCLAGKGCVLTVDACCACCEF